MDYGMENIAFVVRYLREFVKVSATRCRRILSNLELEIKSTSVRYSTIDHICLLHSPLFTMERVLTTDLWYPRNH